MLVVALRSCVRCGVLLFALGWCLLRWFIVGFGGYWVDMFACD